MKKLKRITAGLLALLTSLSFAACDLDKEWFLGEIGAPNSESSSESSSPNEETGNEGEGEGEGDGNENPGENPPVVVPPSGECTSTKGHDFVENNGTCIHCNQKAKLPTLSDGQTFPRAEGEGSEYNPIDLEEGCHTIEFTSYSSRNVWLSFSAEETGQFVLYSVGGDNDATATFYPSAGEYVNHAGKREALVEEDNFYSYVNRGEAYAHGNWRATFCLTAQRGTTVRVCFTRVTDPAWEAKNVYKKIRPTEINGVKAEDGPEDLQLVDVPYSSSYFYSDPANGGDGYYHRGTKDKPGEIIYAAISKKATRMFSDASFTTILKNSGTALNLYAGKDEIGDNVIHCYTPFIMNWEDEDAIWVEDRGEVIVPEADPNKNAYQNYCNKDGVYPVNKELHDFLTLYVRAHKPIDSDVTQADFSGKADWLWLAACYYYTDQNLGTEATPYTLTEGTQDIVIPENDFLYCKFDENGYYTLICNDTTVDLDFGDDRDFVQLGELSMLSEVFRLSASGTTEAEIKTSVTVIKHLSEELTMGNIPVTLPAGETIMIHGSLLSGEYKFSWTNSDVEVTVNGTPVSGTSFYQSGEDFYVEVFNPTDEEIDFTLSTQEKGLEVGRNELALPENGVRFINFYAEEFTEYTIQTEVFEVYTVVTDPDTNETVLGQKISEIFVPMDGIIQIAVVVPEGATVSPDELVHGSVTFTLKAA